MLAAIMVYTAIEGWLPKARAIKLNQPLVALSARPDARLPLSVQFDALPRLKVDGFPAERMNLLRKAAESALAQHAH